HTRGRQSVDQIDIRSWELRQELPCIGVHGIQKTPLALGKQEVKRECALATATHAGDDDELSARNGYSEVLEIVFAGALYADRDGVCDGVQFVQHGVKV